jgi:hypothetical protein
MKNQNEPATMNKKEKNKKALIPDESNAKYSMFTNSKNTPIVSAKKSNPPRISLLR